GGPAWRQTTFWPFAQAARLARGRVLRVEPSVPAYDTRAYGAVDTALLTATHDEETGDVAVFAVNRSTTETVGLDVDVRSMPGLRVVEHSVLTDDDVRAANSMTDPDRVRPTPGEGAKVDDGRLTAALPPVSWNVFRLARQA